MIKSYTTDIETSFRVSIKLDKVFDEVEKLIESILEDRFSNVVTDGYECDGSDFELTGRFVEHDCAVREFTATEIEPAEKITVRCGFNETFLEKELRKNIALVLNEAVFRYMELESEEI